jgi:phosphohistidine phosphatase
MELYLVRHVIAEERDGRRWPDDRDRPLSDRGRRRFQRAARGLGRAAPEIDLMLSSPATRAWETAGMLSEGAGWPAPEAEESLAPAVSAAEALRAVAARTLAGGAVPERIAIVGHEPTLSALAALLTGAPGWAIDWRKGGAARIDTAGHPAPGAGMLLWFLPPRLLRALDR